jgi:hypothetical protein
MALRCLFDRNDQNSRVARGDKDSSWGPGDSTPNFILGLLLGTEHDQIGDTATANKMHTAMK